MKPELERTGRSWRPRFAFAVLAALSLAPASAAVAANGTLGYPCGEMPGKLPQDNTGVLAGLPQATTRRLPGLPDSNQEKPVRELQAEARGAVEGHPHRQLRWE